MVPISTQKVACAVRIRTHLSVLVRRILMIAAAIAVGAAPSISEAQSSVTSFVLVNADTEQAIRTITGGAVIDLAQLPSKNINIRANTNPATVGSVRFELNGNTRYRIENARPYALASDDAGDYYRWGYSLGSYTLRAVPYSKQNAMGTAGTARTVKFTITDSSSTNPTPAPTQQPAANSVQSFSLINADNDTEIGTIANGDVLDLSQLPTRNINIRAHTYPAAVGSVRFELNSNANYRVENVAPYALESDSGGDYESWNPAAGIYTVKAVPYTNSDASGTMGTAKTISFSISEVQNPTPVPTAQPGDKVVRPTESTAVFANPGIGIEAGDRVETDNLDPNGLPVRQAYIKYYWKNLEPGDGRYDFSWFDQNLQKAASTGQTLSFRVVVVDNVESGPAWLKNLGVSGTNFTYYGDGPSTKVLWAPNMNDPVVQQRHFRLLAEMGRRYNNHPYVSSIDIGSVGLWGEWHFGETSPSVPMPTLANKKLIIDKYFEYFPDVPKVMQLEDAEGMKHAISRGAGYRGDCLGNMNYQMKYMYADRIAYASAENAWQKAPVLMESCWDISYWVNQGWDVNYILNWALQRHTSALHNKNRTIPSSAMTAVRNFMRKAGYRYVIREMSHPGSVQRGSSLPVNMKWANVGVAPTYGEYRLAFQLRNSSGAVVHQVVTTQAAKNWMPGEFGVSANVSIPSGLASGNYTLAVGLVNPQTNTSEITLAITNSKVNGWYPLSTVSVQ